MTDLVTAEQARELLDRITRIETDIDDFDGDRRGHYYALDDAKEALNEIAPTSPAPSSPDPKNWPSCAPIWKKRWRLCAHLRIAFSMTTAT